MPRHRPAIAGLVFRGWIGSSLLLTLALLDADCAMGQLTEVIRVKVVVDEEERAATLAWHQRLHQRIDQASSILNQYANIRFTVSEFSTWDSDDRETDLNRSLRELEHEVDPAPSDLVIGFSSQYRFLKGINGLGGTRGPLHTHVLLRETAPNAAEPERLEALVHELGHFLGAAHSSDTRSAMRPVVGDGKARSPTFRIGLDAENGQIVQLVATEVSTLGVRKFGQLSPATRESLLHHYRLLARELPRDPAAPRFIAFLEGMQRGR